MRGIDRRFSNGADGKGIENELDLPFCTAQPKEFKDRTATYVCEIVFNKSYDFDLNSSYTFEIDGTQYTGCRPEKLDNGDIRFDLTKARRGFNISVSHD